MWTNKTTNELAEMYKNCHLEVRGTEPNNIPSSRDQICDQIRQLLRERFCHDD